MPRQLLQTSFCKLSRPCKNSHCFQKIVRLFNLWCESYCAHNWPTLHREKQANNNWRLFSDLRLLEIRVCKKVLLKEEILLHYQNSGLFLNFWYFTHLLIPTQCLVFCMFQLRDVCFINLILIIFPSHSFALKIFYIKTVNRFN